MKYSIAEILKKGFCYFYVISVKNTKKRILSAITDKNINKQLFLRYNRDIL